MFKLVLVVAVLCAVIANSKSDGNGYNGRPYGTYQPMPEYTRIKRVKYSSPPSRLYNRPPPSYLSKGAYSNTPPPNWMDNDRPPPSHSGYSRPKVSSKPHTSEGLGDEDLQNFAKYLSQQDLDRIIEFAGYNRDSERPKDQFEKHVDYRPMTDDYRTYSSLQDIEHYSSRTKDDTKTYSAFVQHIDVDPILGSRDKPTEYRNEYEIDFPANYVNDNQDRKTKVSNNLISNVDAPISFEFNQEKTVRLSNYQASLPTDSSPLAYFNKSPIKNQLNNKAIINQGSSDHISSQNDGVLYTDSKIMPEEPLPPPLNLRDDQDFDVSFTNHVPKVVSPSYTLEDFGDLPLMDYSSKLDTLSSYHVPHYTVTSSKSQSSSSSYSSPPISYGASSSSKVPVEPAPPISAAKEQSDAHLKAVRIWSHKSTGAAYTLHDDGSLSPERPGRPKGSHGYP